MLLTQTRQGTFASVVETQSNQICWPTKSSPQTVVLTQWGSWESLAPWLISWFLPVECKYLNQWSICVAFYQSCPFQLLKWKLLLYLGCCLFCILDTRCNKYLDSGEQVIKILKIYAEKKVIWKDCYKTDIYYNLCPVLIGLWCRLYVMHSKV